MIRLSLQGSDFKLMDVFPSIFVEGVKEGRSGDAVNRQFPDGTSTNKATTTVVPITNLFYTTIDRIL